MSETLREVAIKDIKIGKRFRKDLGSLDGLASSIYELGLLQPIGVTKDLTLIFGERRLRAMEALERETILCRVLDLDSILRGEHDENEFRKELKISERTALARALEERYAEQLGERRGRPKKGEENNCGQMPTISKPGKSPGKGEKSREAAARDSGFGTADKLRRAEKVASQSSQAVREAVDAEAVSLSDAAAVAEEPAEVQDQALELVSAGKAKTLKRAVEQVNSREAHADETPTDLFGQPIPAHLLPLVDDANLFAEAEEKARELRLLLQRIEKTQTWGDRPTGNLPSYCKTIEGQMKLTKFGFVCFTCKGEPAKVPCEKCLGKLWYPVSAKDTVHAKKHGMTEKVAS